MLASVSSRLLPEYREYERTSTTAVNAYLMPVMDRYLAELEAGLGGAELRIMQSNEGYISAARARLEPDPDGPLRARPAASSAPGTSPRAAGFPNVISFDMGGTSTDVSLIDGRGPPDPREPRSATSRSACPIIDIHSVGAGGGSIAAVDARRLAPRRAARAPGPIPGPACYGRGERPTVTDADLVLGRLDPDFFLGGRMRIDPDRSRARRRPAGRPDRQDRPLETAQGIVDIANANMEKAIRVISVERGSDPRDFALFSFGGAGGMHAVEMAAHLGLPTVIVAPERRRALRPRPPPRRLGQGLHEVPHAGWTPRSPWPGLTGNSAGSRPRPAAT